MLKARAFAAMTTATILGLGLAGCGSSGSGSAAQSNAGHPIGDSAIQAVDVVSRAGPFQHPLDAALSPDGSVTYFLATTSQGPAVFRVADAGGALSTVATGAPLAQPRGVAVATDGSRLFVADQQAGGGGAILTMSATAGGPAPVVLPGTQGLAPHGLDVANQGATDALYFTGTDPTTHEAALFEVSSAGGTVSTIAQGAPLRSPDSVVVTGQGVAYVTDQGSGAGQGKVFRVVGGTVSTVLSGLTLGSPGGVTLVNHDATLLVSSVNAATGSDQVLFLDLATGHTATATKVVGTNKNSSGGLHRAHDAASAAWADTQGTVYRIRFPVGA